MTDETERPGAALDPVFDALPFPAFVLDADLRLLSSNRAARRQFGSDPSAGLRGRHGELLHCVNSTTSPEGCGRSAACGECVVRRAVGFVVEHGEPVRIRARMEYMRDGQVQALHALVTAAPCTIDGERRSLLYLEDLAVLFASSDALMVCTACRAIRDRELWEQVEAYLEDHVGLKTTHGLCPACRERLYPRSV